MTWSSVDLPDPDWPMTAVILDRSTARSTPRSAWTMPSPDPKVLVTPMAAAAGSVVAACADAATGGADVVEAVLDGSGVPDA
jgi:ApbE superfamily uncharacterized protein (UPF0280 family)